MGCEISRETVHQCSQQDGSTASDQMMTEQVRAQRGQERVQPQLAEHGAEPHTGEKEWPIERIPRAHLQIGEDRETRENTGGPKWQLAASQGVSEQLLIGVVVADGVPTDDDIAGKQRDRVERQAGKNN